MILSIFHFEIVLKSNQKSSKCCFCTFKIKLPSWESWLPLKSFQTLNCHCLCLPSPHSGSPSFISPMNVSDKPILKIDYNARINCFSRSSKTRISPMGQNMFSIISLYNLTLQYSSQKNKYLPRPHDLPSVWYDFFLPLEYLYPQCI